MFNLPKCPSSLSTHQNTLPTLENQIHEALQKTLQELQKYRRVSPTTESEKLTVLTDVSINIDFVIEQNEEVNMGEKETT